MPNLANFSLDRAIVMLRHMSLLVPLGLAVLAGHTYYGTTDGIASMVGTALGALLFGFIVASVMTRFFFKGMDGACSVLASVLATLVLGLQVIKLHSEQSEMLQSAPQLAQIINQLQGRGSDLLQHDAFEIEETDTATVRMLKLYLQAKAKAGAALLESMESIAAPNLDTVVTPATVTDPSALRETIHNLDNKLQLIPSAREQVVASIDAMDPTHSIKDVSHDVPERIRRSFIQGLTKGYRDMRVRAEPLYLSYVDLEGQALTTEKSAHSTPTREAGRH